jgi:hypothetical protein
VAQRSVAGNELTWDSWWQGENSEIPRLYRIESLPSTFLLDCHGVIRFSYMAGEDHRLLEENIQSLLRELETK